MEYIETLESNFDAIATWIKNKLFTSHNKK